MCRPWPLTNENGAAMYTMDADDPLKFWERLRDWVTVSVSDRSMAPLLRYVEVFFPIPVLQGVQLLDAARLGATTRTKSHAKHWDSHAILYMYTKTLTPA